MLNKKTVLRRGAALLVCLVALSAMGMILGSQKTYAASQTHTTRSTSAVSPTSRTVAAKGMHRAPSVFVPGLGNVTNTFVFAGSSTTNELTLTITNLHLTTGDPSTILLQPRQSDNQELGFPDEFAVMVITTAPDHIVVRIKRLDASFGWGQNLRLDILIVDQVNNP